ncbi:hypothetical protein QQP08_024199 [Theobroma cacao]|uniref:Uncharacterized protein n=1 Tax=Theobroma cacao TaxID=3641 RepID=A0A061GPS1_THECC|nr:Uncharacterized protein TCM_038447 [Theobroma cacao]WRX31712.1 hypothetical protein QQP08_024199 [Theobroma cacao]
MFLSLLSFMFLLIFFDHFCSLQQGLWWGQKRKQREDFAPRMVTAVNPSTKRIGGRLGFSMRIYVKRMGFGGLYKAWGNYRRNFSFFKLQSLQQALFLIFFFSFW